MNPDSLDSSIHSSLSALYPPFQATAPTILSQLLHVVEGRYGGDSLQCLVDFLIPARRLLERVREAACVQYPDLESHLSGWPLCLYDHIVIHLAPINPLLLSFEDFYLQVVPFEKQKVRIVVRSLSEEEVHDLEETPIPENSFNRIFTEDWLEELNEGRHGRMLSNCVLATEQYIVKVPWDQVAYPAFDDHMDSSSTSSQQEPLKGPSWQGYSVETRICPAKDGIAVSLCLVESSRQSETNQTMPGTRQLGWVSPNTWDSRNKECAVDEDVNSVHLVKDTGDSRTLAQTRTCLQRPQMVTPPGGRDHTAHDRPTCGRTVRFAEQPCTPCLRRKHGQGTKNQECRYKEYCREEPPSVTIENRQKEPIISEKPARADHLHRPVLKQSPKLQTIDKSASKNQRHVPDDSHDLTELNEGPSEGPGEGYINSITPIMFQIESEKGPNEGMTDNKTEMSPRLNVTHGKKTTTFGLVSPKLNRQKLPVQDVQDYRNLPLLANGPFPNKSASSLTYTDRQKPSKRSPFPAPSKPEMCLLQAGLSCLTGGRDRSNRVVVEVYGDHQHWGSPLLSTLALSKLLLYFYTIVRKEEREFGMTIVYDSRKIPPHPEFFEALQMVEEQDPKAVHCLLLLISKEKNYSTKKYPGDMEVVTSLKGLHRYIEYSQLSPALEGTFLYSHRNWLHLHQELYPFIVAMKDAINLLLEAIRKLEGLHKIDTVQDVQQCINDQRVLMKRVLEDTQLVTLQREGGALLAKFRWESDVRAAHYETSWKVMDTMDSLYDEVEEHVHVLVRRSNISFQHLSFLLHLRNLESRFMEIKQWFDVEGGRRILEAECAEEPSRSFEEILQCLTSVLSESNEHRLQAMMLLNEAESIQRPNYPETEVFHIMISTFKSSLSEFLSQAEQYCDEMKTMLNLCHFCLKATEVAVDCSQQLEQDKRSMNHQEKWAALQGCHEKLSQFSPELFQEAKTQAYSLQNPWGKKVWNMTWLRCQEISRQLEETLQELERERLPSLPVPLQYEWHGNAGQESTDGASMLPQPDMHHTPVESPEVKVRQNRDSVHGTVSCFNISFRQSRKGRKGSKMAQVADTDQKSSRKATNTKQTKEDFSSASGSANIQILQSTFTESKTSPPIYSNSQISSPTCSGNPIPPSASFCLETLACQPKPPENASHTEEIAGWGNETSNILASPGMESNTTKLQCIMEEMLLTELEYVKSLAYILTHYLPLLAQPDVPPDLRGQRGRIFGNLEKLYDFHCHYFLQELEACQTEPLWVGRCFLRHRENFGLYALYSKNKPQSDALVRQHKFFKCKQLELGDSMDLSSYLLKPVQRISKYSLLLQEMLEECGSAHGAERLEIQGAAEVVRFQLRHGNDLLTMDAIQDCDVNLQEQGQLIRQDEFYVTFRKKRAVRRVFLFQDLILFTKMKKTHRGDEVYVYKQSFKTCDIGLTQNCGQSGLCFEIWFRRRRAQDTYTLQAERTEMKEAWTADLEHILWEQAMKNRELRRQEQVFMGMGTKPFMKVQPTETTITCFYQGGEIEGLKSPNLATPGLPGDTVLPRPESIGSTSGSQSSSSSGRGSLSPSGFRENQTHESGHASQLPWISYQNRSHVITESPGRYGSCFGGSSGFCGATGGMFTRPAGSQLQQSSPALSRIKVLSSNAHKNDHCSYITEC